MINPKQQGLKHKELFEAMVETATFYDKSKTTRIETHLSQNQYQEENKSFYDKSKTTRIETNTID